MDQVGPITGTPEGGAIPGVVLAEEAVPSGVAGPQETGDASGFKSGQFFYC